MIYSHRKSSFFHLLFSDLICFCSVKFKKRLSSVICEEQRAEVAGGGGGGGLQEEIEG